jgi:tetratricopeptide (TPR) repeat protein
VTGLIKCEKINQLGKLFVILGRRTFSACQNLVNELENYTEATFVGEPTGENVNFFGDNRTVRLPNSDLSVRLSYLWWQDKDPRDKRPFTPPHLAVDLSFADYIANRDPVYEAIMASDRVEPLKEPWSHLEELFMEGKVEELTKTAHAYVKDPRYRYYDFEDRINNAGYQLMGTERYKEARFVFELNAELFANSANCWDSLAESCWRMGDTDKATEYYNKAISMDPDGPTGENARKMLERMVEKK